MTSTGVNNVTSKATKTLGFLRRNLTIAPKGTGVAAYLQLQYAAATSVYGTPFTKQTFIE